MWLVPCRHHQRQLVIPITSLLNTETVYVSPWCTIARIHQGSDPRGTVYRRSHQSTSASARALAYDEKDGLVLLGTCNVTGWYVFIFLLDIIRRKFYRRVLQKNYDQDRKKYRHKRQFTEKNHEINGHINISSHALNRQTNRQTEVSNNIDIFERSREKSNNF